MNEFDGLQVEKYPDIEIGKPLPGLKQSWELKDGVEYWDQVIPTAYGELRYFPFQLRNGTILWGVEPKEDTDEAAFCVTVESATGIVLSKNMG